MQGGGGRGAAPKRQRKNSHRERIEAKVPPSQPETLKLLRGRGSHQIQKERARGGGGARAI
jgi:hypothetical protein